MPPPAVVCGPSACPGIRVRRLGVLRRGNEPVLGGFCLYLRQHGRRGAAEDLGSPCLDGAVTPVLELDVHCRLAWRGPVDSTALVLGEDQARAHRDAGERCLPPGDDPARAHRDAGAPCLPREGHRQMSALADWARFPEDDLVRPIARQPRTTFGQEPWLGGSAATLVYVLAGVLIVPRYGEMVDTVARTANAFYVLFSRYPHLGAIGFVWTPLPSLLALPLVALTNVRPGLVRDAVALNIVSALFGGLAFFFVLRVLHRLNLPGPVRWAMAALLTLNPFVAFYATNGMTDMMMAATLLGAVDGLWAYLEDGYAAHQLAVSGIWMAIGFLMRYELLAWALVVAGGPAGGGGAPPPAPPPPPRAPARGGGVSRRVGCPPPPRPPPRGPVSLF